MIHNEDYIIKNQDGVEYLQFTKLLEYETMVKHAIALKPLDIGTNNNYFEGQKTFEENYKQMCNILSLDSKNVYRPFQTHTDIVKEIKDEDPGTFTNDFKDVDGLVTDQKNKILTIATADCIDILFFDTVKKVIANTHSGWKGTYQEISIKTVDKMVDKYDSDPKDILCFFGPSIRKCHFEVDKLVANDFYKKFSKLDNINKIIVKQEDTEKYNIDTILINKMILLERGLKEKNIIDCGLCTVCNSNKLHSFRADRDRSGRMMGLICLI